MRQMFFVVIVLFFSVSGFLPKNVFATSPASIEQTPQCQTNDPISSCRLAFILETNVQTITKMIIGNPKDQQSMENSASGFFLSMIGATIKTPPVSAQDFISYQSQQFRFPGSPQPVFAVPPTGGTGFVSLYPILKIWTFSRNMVYFLFAVVFVLIGLMIIFRIKVDAKTVATVQGSLPKIIFALILVTFSYAIAGFLIDLLYVLIGLILTIIRAIGIGNLEADLAGHLKNNDSIVLFFFDSSMWYSITSASAAVGNILDSLLNWGFAGNVTSFLASGLASLIIAIAIIWALVKTWAMLISAYAQIILGVIFAPFQLMLEAIPGQNQFEMWLRNMMAYILSFPAVLIMMYLAMALSTNFGEGIKPGDVYSGFVPPLIGGNSQVAIQALVGLAIMLTIPKTVEILQQVLKAPQNKWGNAWGEAVNIGRAGAGTLAGYGGRAAYENIGPVKSVVGGAKPVLRKLGFKIP